MGGESLDNDFLDGDGVEDGDELRENKDIDVVGDE
jgi:hypothetical protein